MPDAAFDKIVVVTKKTALEELTERLATRGQAKFYLEQEAARAVGGPDFAAYERADATYHAALDTLKTALPAAVRVQIIERSFLPTFTFGARDLVITLGPDGLVVNTAKYLSDQPLVAFNPDPATIEGVLLPLGGVSQSAAKLRQIVAGKYSVKPVTMARARLADGQTLYAVNDLFIGQKTHVSARYQLRWNGASEAQSSSGIIVSTGAGSTGWLRSIIAGAAGVVTALGGDPGVAAQAAASRFDWDAPRLRFSVREPWASRTTGAGIVSGVIEAGQELEVVSQMPQSGVIFSDGVEEDFLSFSSGAVARIGVADRKARLVIA